VSVLDVRQLERFEVTLERHAGSLVARLGRGLPADEIRAVLAAHGMVAGEEVLTWWAWRDGNGLELLPTLRNLSVAGAGDGYVALRRLAGEQAESSAGYEGIDQVDDWWHHTWLPIFATGGLPKVAIECSGQPGPSPVLEVDWSDVGGSNFPTVLAPSLGDLISYAIEAIESERYRFDADRDHWFLNADVPAAPGSPF
jgi:hypothetical protein